MLSCLLSVVSVSNTTDTRITTRLTHDSMRSRKPMTMERCFVVWVSCGVTHPQHPRITTRLN